MDIFRVIKDAESRLLLMNLAISSFQKRIAQQFDIQPGQEMIQGIESAKQVGAELVLADRNIQVTFSHIGNCWIFWKAKLYGIFLAFSAMRRLPKRNWKK